MEILIILCVMVIHIFEAFAHYNIIKGLTRCGQPEKENRLWHLGFFMMWGMLSVLIILIDFRLWPLIPLISASRLLIFPISLNILRGKSPVYLSEKGMDGVMIKVGLGAAFIIRWAFFIFSIYLFTELCEFKLSL